MMAVSKMVQARQKKPPRWQWQGWLIQLWFKFLDQCDRRNEPVIWQRRDRQGREWWIAYDPVCSRTVSLSSEAEARLWLDQLRPF
jgi:hypothetical protein